MHTRRWSEAVLSYACAAALSAGGGAAERAEHAECVKALRSAIARLTRQQLADCTLDLLLQEPHQQREDCTALAIAGSSADKRFEGGCSFLTQLLFAADDDDEKREPPPASSSLTALAATASNTSASAGSGVVAVVGPEGRRLVGDAGWLRREALREAMFLEVQEAGAGGWAGPTQSMGWVGGLWFGGGESVCRLVRCVATTPPCHAPFTGTPPFT